MDFDRMLQYAAALEANNNRLWFHANHKQYEEAKADFEELVTLMKFRVAEVSPSLGDQILFMPSKDLMYRIPRDMRYNKGKPPYNPTFRAHFSPDRHGQLPLGYFLMIAPGDRSDLGTGLFPTTTKALHRARSYIDENCETWLDIIENSGLEIHGDKLKNVPQGFSPDSPVSEWLKYKYWFVTCGFSDNDLTTFDSFLDKASSIMMRLEPIRLFLTDAAMAADDDGYM